MLPEFPEDALEALAAECDQTAKDWIGEGRSGSRRAIGEKWSRKAAILRQAIDSYRAATNREPVSRRSKLAAMVADVAEKMDYRKAASGDR